MFDMIGFTLIGQVLDRIGMIASVVLVALLDYALHGMPFGSFALSIVGGSFVISGLLIGLMTMYVCTRRWGVAKKRSLTIAILAGIFTNPAWAMGAVAVPGFATK